MKFTKVSLGKETSLNEDAVYADSNMIAVSDGAGGGGLFADKWSNYLLTHLPSHPMLTFKSLDEWIDSIWENFYNQMEIAAKKLGSVEVNKFYDEGSLATIAAMWENDNIIDWVTYGDSTVFCYDYDSKILSSNIVDLRTYNEAPYLINVNSPLQKDGITCGSFQISKSRIFFCASDALSHYILASYFVANKQLFEDKLQYAIDCNTKNSNFIKTLLAVPHIDFERDVLLKLFNSSKNKGNFAKHIHKLHASGKIALDDYSIAFLYSLPFNLKNPTKRRNS